MQHLASVRTRVCWASIIFFTIALVYQGHVLSKTLERSAAAAHPTQHVNK